MLSYTLNHLNIKRASYQKEAHLQHKNDFVPSPITEEHTPTFFHAYALTLLEAESPVQYKFGPDTSVFPLSTLVSTKFYKTENK
jgi:hypothetical protein